MTDCKILALPKRPRKPPEPERRQPSNLEQVLDAEIILRMTTIMRECRK